MLLSQKKLLAFKGASGVFVLLVLGVAIILGALPQETQAGFLSSLMRFLLPPAVEIEESFPALIPEIRAAATSALFAQNRPPAGPGDTNDEVAFAVVQDDALVAPLNPVGTIPPPDARGGGQIFIYTIRTGDTLSTIAKSFDVSVNTILWANSISDIRSLKVGSQLVILPMTGVRHEVKSGDTVISIAKKYRAGIEDILQFNGLAPDESLKVGSVVMVPDGEFQQAAPLTASAPRREFFSNLPLYEGYYVRPILAGRRSRGIHGYNGIDLADSCGLPVIASADGQVLIARTGGWNGGYGRYIVVSHPNQTQTLYAHLREVMVAIGQSVRQGETIATIGSSGNSTGCHIHFEVRGARNPF